MFRTWTASDDDPEALARVVEGRLNEYAEVIHSVSYSVSAGRHYVMAVYTEIDFATGDEQLEAAVSLAEEIVEGAASGLAEATNEPSRTSGRARRKLTADS